MKATSIIYVTRPRCTYTWIYCMCRQSTVSGLAKLSGPDQLEYARTHSPIVNSIKLAILSNRSVSRWTKGPIRGVGSPGGDMMTHQTVNMAVMEGRSKSFGQGVGKIDNAGDMLEDDLTAGWLSTLEWRSAGYQCDEIGAYDFH
jgi:hypothetical protein